MRAASELLYQHQNKKEKYDIKYENLRLKIEISCHVRAEKMSLVTDTLKIKCEVESKPNILSKNKSFAHFLYKALDPRILG